MCKVYTMSQGDFLAYNDATHVFVEKHDEYGNVALVSLYDLVKAYISQFGGDKLKNAIDAVDGRGQFINADLIFIHMCLFTEPSFGLFFTGKFRYNDKIGNFTLSEITSMISAWVERAWSFWHFESIMDQRLFFAALLVRMELAANPHCDWAVMDERIRSFFSTSRPPEDPFELLFDDWCSKATKHVEMALEFSSFASPDAKEHAHVPFMADILAFAMSRRVPEYVEKGGAWIMRYFHGVNFRYAGRLNVIYKPERTYETMEGIKTKVENAVSKYRADAEAFLTRIEDKVDENGNKLSKRAWDRYVVALGRQKMHNNVRQKKKDLEILAGTYGCDEDGKPKPGVVPYHGRFGEEARELREEELRTRAARNSYIYTRILDSFPLMNRVSDVKQTNDGMYQVTVQLYSYRQYAKEVDKIYSQCQDELKAAVTAKMSMRRCLRAIFLAQQSSQAFGDLSEVEKEKLRQKAEEDMKNSGEWEKMCGAITNDFLEEQYAKIKGEDARVNYTIDVEEDVIENPLDFSNTALQMAAIIPGVEGLYINERVRRGVLRIHSGRQKTYAQYAAEIKTAREEMEKVQKAVEDAVAGKQ